MSYPVVTHAAPAVVRAASAELVTNIFEIGIRNILPMIEAGGLTIRLESLDGSAAGRVMNGRMYRDLIGYKLKIEAKLMPLQDADAKALFAAVMPEFFYVTIDTPYYGIVTREFYCGELQAGLKSLNYFGQKYWTGIALTLIER